MFRIKVKNVDFGIINTDDPQSWVQDWLVAEEIDQNDTLFIDYINQMNDAIEKYGEHIFYDKDADDIFQLTADSILKLEPDEARYLINRIYNYSKIGQFVAKSLVTMCENAKDDWWDEMTTGINVNF